MTTETALMTMTTKTMTITTMIGTMTSMRTTKRTTSMGVTEKGHSGSSRDRLCSLKSKDKDGQRRTERRTETDAVRF